MLGKIIGAICFMGAVVSLLSAPVFGVYAAISLFVSCALFWVLGVFQASLEKIEYFAEYQKNLLERNKEQNIRIIGLLEKIAGEPASEPAPEKSDAPEAAEEKADAQNEQCQRVMLYSCTTTRSKLRSAVEKN